MHQIFLLSPANLSGKRTQMVLNRSARFEVAQKLRSSSGISLGEVFTFLSGLYFRGKFTYAQAFAKPPKGVHGIFVITSNKGLIPIDQKITSKDLQSFSKTPISPDNPRYRLPLQRDARQLAKQFPSNCEFVLLGSIASNKYADLLLPFFGERLYFPKDFVGRGDMSRGGLLLRNVSEGKELDYAQFVNAKRSGCRPEKLSPYTRPPSVKKP